VHMHFLTGQLCRILSFLHLVTEEEPVSGTLYASDMSETMENSYNASTNVIICRELFIVKSYWLEYRLFVNVLGVSEIEIQGTGCHVLKNFTAR
jgi:hypothetical protein